jgi:prepilin peptidase CpaA
MVATVLLLVLLLIATVTDVRHHKIYNWTTYPGILAALGLNTVGAVVEHEPIANPADDGPGAEGDDRLRGTWGFVGAEESLIGFAVCGGFMLVTFVFFHVGGGDVKLMAMLGAFLGFERGLEALLWTFVLAACLGLIVLIWRVGALRLIGRVWRQAMFALRIGGWADLEPTERERLQFPLFLAPTALAAVTIVEFAPPEIFRGTLP